MKAEYNKWYKCQEGQMPEDFENMPVGASQIYVCQAHNGVLFTDKRVTNWGKFMWSASGRETAIAWMLPELYKEQ